MALCLAALLLAKNTLDPLDVRQWRDHDESSRTGYCFEIAGTMSAAPSRFERNGDPLAGSSDPQTAEPLSLMPSTPQIAQVDSP